MAELRFLFGELLLEALNGTIATSVGKSSCFLFSTRAQACPVCQVWVPANTRHQCAQELGERTVGRGRTQGAAVKRRRRR